jgi:transforming growth factor-beta-induced protein
MSGSAPTLKSGSNIDVVVTGTNVKLNGNSNVIATDVQGSNGVIHAIDTVLLP